ncbi:unnamed protein product [Allacma fusca]|uniref:Uncharacterized protein n=1 Tax=Allacma fusca TaxID=39272 RepID=A0A8J2KNR9_9HEXA|nr:unnamed protein product [Allacma fusca]
MPKIISKPPLTKLQRLGLLFKIPYDTAANILFTWQAGKFPGSLDPSQTKELVLSISPVMSVQDVKTVKNRFQVSYSAVLCALYFGAIDRALQVLGLKDIPNLASTSLVIPEGNHPGGLVIHAGMMYTSWPIKSVSPVERLQMIQDSLRILSQSSAPYAYSVLAESLSFYPIRLRTVLTRKLLSTWKHSLDGTHLPVTSGMDMVFGLEIKDLFAGNVPWLASGLTCTSGGLNNKFKFTFASYKGFFGEGDVGRQLGIYAHDELRALLLAATKKI